VLQADLQASGVRLMFESEVVGAEPCIKPDLNRGRRATSAQLKLEIIKTGDCNKKRPAIFTDMVLTATGRSAVTSGLGLKDAGVGLAPNGDICVDSQLQTSVPGVYAAGDAIGAPQLASTGIAQAESAIETICAKSSGDECTALDMSPQALLSNAARYPIGIWTLPEVSFVGLTKEAAEKADLSVIEGVGRYSSSIRGHLHTIGTPKEGEYLRPRGSAHNNQAAPTAASSVKEPTAPLTGPALKLVVERGSEVIVGVHVFGDDACELIHFGTTLVQGKKTLADTLALCYAAVTYHELYKLAALDALAIIQREQWRTLYYTLDRDGDGTLTYDEASVMLTQAGVSDEEFEDICRALFAGPRTTGEAVSVEAFVKRASRLRAPLQKDLLANLAFAKEARAECP
jgi:hypothetical protein